MTIIVILTFVTFAHKGTDAREKKAWKSDYWEEVGKRDGINEDKKKKKKRGGSTEESMRNTKKITQQWRGAKKEARFSGLLANKVSGTLESVGNKAQLWEVPCANFLSLDSGTQGASWLLSWQRPCYIFAGLLVFLLLH